MRSPRTNLSGHGDPIVAIATAPAKAAVGIVRASGTRLLPLVQAICKRPIPPREAIYTAFVDTHGEAIDHGIALFFPAPHSFTGEDVLELQAHGGPIVLQMLLARCLEAAATVGSDGSPVLARLRIAQPGEFTLRAFLHDKIDLVQAESIADLIDASTQAAARSASRSLSGAFSLEVHGLQDGLIALRTLVEATLDFPEEDIDPIHRADATARIQTLLRDVDTVLNHCRQGAMLRDGLNVVIAGQPNVGKSTLLNTLAGQELAIVTAIPGTTRDRIERTLHIDGVPLHLSDTAGLRNSDCEVERIGIARTWEAIRNADVVLFLHDASRSGQADYRNEEDTLAQAIAQHIGTRTQVLDVWNKADLAPVAPFAPVSPNAPTTSDVAGIRLSAKTGSGLDALRKELLRLAGWQGATEGLYLARQRHIDALHAVHRHLDHAHHQLGTHTLDIAAEELRLAHDALGSITGEFTADDLLGTIFAQFCIGK
ncbi:tRNA modification GTPase [Candidatus Symbiobacter mobilis CR]|uniref:tRNA modification GTPase MnmE n=2 Tax=Candidatus Symbiobacter TaxID=1436289 RepID=U5NB05_9BURK|nr:tRNA modification GTPase [Candidatus Symbiobacter mobilis CR]